jgi:DNA-binding FadR family transcriptional regulator
MTSHKTTEISTTLRDEILLGQYRPGERLPSERDLAARFCTNRGAVREAIKILEQLGIANVQPGGVRVVPVEEATLGVLSHLMNLDKSLEPYLIENVIEVFGSMLSLSARSAINKATPEQIGELTENVEKLKTEGIMTEESWKLLANQFISINQNLVLKLIANGLQTQFLGRMNPNQNRVAVNRDVASRKLLDNLAVAIEANNGDAAANSITMHFDYLREIYQQIHPTS